MCKAVPSVQSGGWHGAGRGATALLGFISAVLESREQVGWCTGLAARGREEGWRAGEKLHGILAQEQLEQMPSII